MHWNAWRTKYDLIRQYNYIVKDSEICENLGSEILIKNWIEFNEIWL